MRVKTNKYGEVNIRWQYNFTNGDRDVTKAFLEKKVNKETQVLCEVSVVRHPNERYDKLIARKFALEKLLKYGFSTIYLDEKSNKEVFKRTPELSEDRKIIWEAYKNMKTSKTQL